MKDRLKDWILCHERFYWYIIVGLAVFAFGVVTAFGFAKVQKAHAGTVLCLNAGQIDYDFLPSYDQLVDIIGSYYDISEGVNADNTLMLSLSTSISPYYNLCVFYGSNIDYLIASSDSDSCLIKTTVSNTSALYIKYEDGKFSHHVSSFSGGFMRFNLSDAGTYKGYIWGKPFKCEQGFYINEVSTYPKAPVPYTYNVSAPYVDNVIVSINNVLPVDNKTIDIERSEWVVNYDILTPWFAGTDYKLVNKYYVWLPTKDYFDKLYAGWYFPLDVQNGMTIKDLDLHTLKSDITAFQKNVGKTDRGICYTFLKEESVSNGRVKYDYRDFLESIQEAYGHEDVNGELVDFSLADYYGFKETDSEWLNLYRPVLMSFLYVSRMDSLLYCSVEDSNYYGPYMVFDFLPEKFEGVTTKIEVDPLNTENLNSIIETGRLESLKNEMYNVAGENDSLSNQLGSIDLTLGAFGNGLSGSDLWTGFSSLSAGLASLVPSITSVAFLIGSVFSFLPVQLTTILAFTLLALCIIAIIKAIRG